MAISAIAAGPSGATAASLEELKQGSGVPFLEAVETGSSGAVRGAGSERARPGAAVAAAARDVKRRLTSAPPAPGRSSDSVTRAERIAGKIAGGLLGVQLGIAAWLAAPVGLAISAAVGVAAGAYLWKTSKKPVFGSFRRDALVIPGMAFLGLVSPPAVGFLLGMTFAAPAIAKGIHGLRAGIRRLIER